MSLLASSAAQALGVGRPLQPRNVCIDAPLASKPSVVGAGPTSASKAARFITSTHSSSHHLGESDSAESEESGCRDG